jgi:hypothetical protein
MAVAGDIGDWYFNGGRMIPKGGGNIMLPAGPFRTISILSVL